MYEFTAEEKQMNEIVPLMQQHFGKRSAIGIPISYASGRPLPKELRPAGFDGAFYVCRELGHPARTEWLGSGDTPLAAWLDALRRRG